MEQIKEEKLELIYQQFTSDESNIIPILQSIQEAFGYVPEDAVTWFSKKSGIPVAKFFGVATFYAQFHLKPRGKNVITVCSGTVCHVKGAPRLISKIREDLKLKDGEDTTKDMRFTLENVNCLGACSRSPVVVVNDTVFGMMTPAKIVKNLKPIKEKSRE